VLRLEPRHVASNTAAKTLGEGFAVNAFCGHAVISG
jgi:hypothetical protein